VGVSAIGGEECRQSESGRTGFDPSPLRALCLVPPADHKSLDSAYADAMRAVWNKYPQDPDVGTLFADAMMNLRPWNLFYPDGQPAPGTTEIMATLERVMSLVPDHPGANHFYIHTVEMSPFPKLALKSANVLRHRIPGAGTWCTCPRTMR